MCLQVNSKSPHSAQCVKSRVLNKAIDSILSIDTFEQQFVVIKFMLQSSRLEDHMKTIGIEKSSFTRPSFEKRFMNNIKKIYQHAGKCNAQQNLKDVLEAAILSTPEGFIDNIHNVPLTSTPVKKPSARKLLCLFTNILDVKPTTAKRRFVAAKYRHKVMKVCNSLWTKTNQNEKGIQKSMSISNVICTQVVQSPIFNHCLKVLLDDQTELQLVPKFLPRVSVTKLHNSLVSDPNDGGLKDARDEDSNIIICDSTLRLLLPPQF